MDSLCWVSSHFLAVGHTRWPNHTGYGMFGYLFAAAEPFALTATTPEFIVNSTIAAKLPPIPWWRIAGNDPRPQRVEEAFYLRGRQSSIRWGEHSGANSLVEPLQFPMGIVQLNVRIRPVRIGDGWLLLSWGRGDRDTMVTRLHQSELLVQMRRL
jgi:hypothetical protein